MPHGASTKIQQDGPAAPLFRVGQEEQPFNDSIRELSVTGPNPSMTFSSFADVRG